MLRLKTTSLGDYLMPGKSHKVKVLSSGQTRLAKCLKTLTLTVATVILLNMLFLRKKLRRNFQILSYPGLKRMLYRRISRRGKRLQKKLGIDKIADELRKKGK